MKNKQKTQLMGVVLIALVVFIVYLIQNPRVVKSPSKGSYDDGTS